MRAVPEDVVERAVYVQAPFDAVWAALTDPEWHEDWHVAPCQALGHRKGARCAWGEDRGAPVITGTVESFRPATGQVSHSFAYTFLDEPESLVEWEVEEHGRVTSVWLRHHLDGRHRSTRVMVAGGWFLVLSRLKTLVETGKPMALPSEPE